MSDPYRPSQPAAPPTGAPAPAPGAAAAGPPHAASAMPAAAPSPPPAPPPPPAPVVLTPAGAASPPVPSPVPPPPGGDVARAAQETAREAFAVLDAQGRRVLSRLDPTGWRPTLIVGGILLALVLGTQVVNGVISVPRPQVPGGPAPVVQPGTPTEIARGVRIYTLPGWVADSAALQDGLRLEKGAVVVDVYVAAGAYPDAGTLFSAYVRDALQANASQITLTPPQLVQVASGRAAVRGSYLGTFPQSQQPVEGQVTATLLGDRGVVADAWASQGALSQALTEVGLMIDTLEVRP